MRVLKIAGAALAAVLVILALLVIVGVPSGLMNSAIQAWIERGTGYRLTVAGATRLGVWPNFSATMNDATLKDPRDRDAASVLTADSIRAEMALGSLWAGRPEITELAIVRPILHVPLLRQRTREVIAPAGPPAAPAAADAGFGAIDRIVVSDGVIVFSNPGDHVENHIEGIAAEATIDADRKMSIIGHARAGEHPLRFGIKATAPLARQSIPVELTLDTSGLLQAPVTARAEVRLNGAVLMVNGMSGTIGDGAFSGWASADLASKPLVKLDLDFQRLDLATPQAGSASVAPNPSQPWSRASIDLIGLNYFDVQAKISAAELNVGEAHLAPVAVEAALAGGVLKARFGNLGAYGGHASGDLTVDATSGNPGYALRADIGGVRALPLLRGLAGFEKLDGRLQAKIAVHSSGASQLAILSNLGGTVFAVFQDGAIRGLNVAQMIRALTSGTLSGWQEGGERATDLTQLGASFRIENGQAATGDLNLVGPLVRVTGSGTVDLPAQTLALRVEPKLVLTTEGQGRSSDPVGLGIPVAIDGPWAEPRIYPDVTGMLENPEAAYARLKEMGKGLFGALGNLGGGGTAGSDPSDPLGGKLGETLGNLIQQGLAQGRGMPAGAPKAATPAPDDAAPKEPQDSQPMNDLLRQLFNR